MSDLEFLAVLRLLGIICASSATAVVFAGCYWLVKAIVKDMKG